MVKAYYRLEIKPFMCVEITQTHGRYYKVSEGIVGIKATNDLISSLQVPLIKVALKVGSSFVFCFFFNVMLFYRQHFQWKYNKGRLRNFELNIGSTCWENTSGRIHPRLPRWQWVPTTNRIFGRSIHNGNLNPQKAMFGDSNLSTYFFWFPINGGISDEIISQDAYYHFHLYNKEVFR